MKRYRGVGSSSHFLRFFLMLFVSLREALKQTLYSLLASGRLFIVSNFSCQRQTWKVTNGANAIPGYIWLCGNLPTQTGQNKGDICSFLQTLGFFGKFLTLWKFCRENYNKTIESFYLILDEFISLWKLLEYAKVFPHDLQDKGDILFDFQKKHCLLWVTI